MLGYRWICHATPQAGAMVRAESPAWGIGSGNWPPGFCNSPATPRAAVASFLFQRAPDAAAERPRDGSAAAPAPTLTHMSLEADAHVMTGHPAT